MPPLKMVQAGVQIRFTIGLIPVTCNNTPARIKARPIVTKNFNLSFGAVAAFNAFPANNPSIIVPNVGMKLSVEYPPSLLRKGFSLGNKFKNHLSKAQAKWVGLFQWAARPCKLCSQPGVTPAAA